MLKIPSPFLHGATDVRVTGRCVGPPHFTSQWTEVEAQTTKSSVTLEHECGEFPAKVELQIRPLAGNSSNFYFPGLGSAQRNDDINRTYGGIVYKYNKFEVILYIPKANDGYPSGVIIYTGTNLISISTCHLYINMMWIARRIIFTLLSVHLSD